MKKVIFYLLFAISSIMATAASTQEEFPANALPEQFLNRHATERMKYTGAELYDYMNGGAEVYISYGLVSMTGCKYESDTLPQITVEVYEMTSPANAFGVFTHSRDREEYDYGQGSQTFPDFILFWKGNYFVIINTVQVTDESSAAIKTIASLIENEIHEQGNYPSIVRAIPKKDLVPGAFLYFHHYIWLNAYYFIADHNILNIDDHTDAILAKYGEANERRYLLEVYYPSEGKAEIAYNQLLRKYAPELLNSDKLSIRLEDKTWFSAIRKGNLIAAVFNGPDKEKTETLIKAAIN